tara:strand:- start:2137 stop:2604 length:468 start_codon:yes stop_codon:yes gene_type:complete
MAIIYSYPLQTTIDPADLLTGTKKNAISPSQNPTVCWTMGTLSTFIKDDILGYNAYTSLLTQSGAVNPPTATILKNDTGATMTWARTGLGTYTCTASSPIFTINKTIVFLNLGDPAIAGTIIKWTRTSTSIITISMDPAADDKLDNGAFEIRIYS